MQAQDAPLEEVHTPIEEQSLQLQDSVARTLADPSLRIIISSTIESARSLADHSRNLNTPLSTCHRRIGELLEEGVLVAQRIIATR